MQRQTLNGITFLVFENLNSYNRLFHAVSTRIGGVSPAPFHTLNLGNHTDDSAKNIRSNYESLAKSLGFDLQSVVTSHQVHGTSIAHIEKVPDRRVPFPAEHPLDGYDAFITAAPGVVLMVRVADCVPVILFDPVKKVLGVVHAGWKGTLGGICGKTIKSMIDQYGCKAENIKAGIGPSIGPCCFTVQDDVAESFRTKFTDAGCFICRRAEKTAIDLKEANKAQLIHQGCFPQHIEASEMCTACSLNLFFSHRGEQGKTGRFALLAGLRP